jgi:hypothetical protein
MKYLSPTYEIGKIHPLAKTNTVNQKDINRIPTRLKLATGNYMLQTMRASLLLSSIMLFIVGARRYSKVLQHIKKCETVSSAWLHSLQVGSIGF